MNTVPTIPPDRDLRPATRERQRDELIAILEHETTTRTVSRRLVPLAAAAAVVLVAGVAIAVPALRPDKGQPPVGGAVGRLDPSGWQLEPLSAAEREQLAAKCAPELDQTKKIPGRVTSGGRTADPKPAKPDQEILDGFRYTNAPTDAAATQWVVKKKVGEWFACGFDQKGRRVTGLEAGPGQPMYGVVDPSATGTGMYLKSIRRITVTPHGGQPVEAILRDGYYYAPVRAMKDVVSGPSSTPLPYVTRGYDANGTLVYTSHTTLGEVREARSRCWVGPDGELAYYMSPKPTSTANCLKMVAWDNHPVAR
ncbi:hypothetical protein AB0L70_00475 [Kribbella sp. NPDC051952]|uniref:hypothetical protein n=1 Tax=Kribbella sp. NPDC051952 TaxID=3154851 RepID=UPI00344177E3